MFTLTLSGPSALSTRVRYQTADGTAIAASDYTARSGEIVFAAGVTSMTVSIAVIGDTTPEADETFLREPAHSGQPHDRRRAGRGYHPQRRVAATGGAGTRATLVPAGRA